MFQISYLANTTDTDLGSGVSGVSKDQKNCEKSKTTPQQVQVDLSYATSCKKLYQRYKAYG